MQQKSVLLALCVLCAAVGFGQKKFDTTMKLGKAGYRVYAANRSYEKNMVTVSPVGFESGVRDASVELKGKIRKCEVDDLNADGFPDLVIYLTTNEAKNTGSVVAVTSQKNEGLAPIIFPDILDDPKIRQGYVGNDEFSLMEGTLLRRFPLYSTTDTANIKPTGVMRQVMYRLQPDERGNLIFKVSRSYDFNKP